LAVLGGIGELFCFYATSGDYCGGVGFIDFKFLRLLLFYLKFIRLLPVSDKPLIALLSDIISELSSPFLYFF